MEVIIPIVVTVFVLIWAFRLEVGMNKANEALARIEKELKEKKGKK